MSENKKEIKKEVQDKKQSPAQVFAQAYQELCNQLGHQVVANPVWIARDDGTFSMKVQFSIGKLPKEEK